MSDLVPIDPARGFQPPAKARARLQSGGSLAKNFSSGMAGGFPVLSIRASKFHLRMDGAEITIPDEKGYAASYIDVVLIDAAERLAKSFYIDAYSGDANQPDCWSLDSVRPDPSASKKQNPTCQDCRHNAFGSKFTPEGKPAKACADQRRVALCFPRDLASPTPQVMLLRVPPSSLKNLRNHVDKLVRNGYEPDSCITRMSFEGGKDISFPKLQFEFYGPLDDQEYDTVEALRVSPNVKAMLAGAELINAAGGANAASTLRTGLVPTPGPVQGLTIDAVVNQGGFAAGDLSEPKPVPMQPVQQPEPVPVRQAAPAQQETKRLVQLETGEWLDTETGELVDAPAAEPVEKLDPDIITMKDGRFFHRVQRQLVDSPYVGAKPWAPPAAKPAAAKPAPQPEVEEAEEEKAEPKQRRGRKPRQAQEAAAETSVEPQVTPEEPPVETRVQTNGGGERQAKPAVVAASPKLEALLGKLVPNRDD